MTGQLAPSGEDLSLVLRWAGVKCGKFHKAYAAVKEEQDDDEGGDEGHGHISHVVGWYPGNTENDHSQNSAETTLADV